MRIRSDRKHIARPRSGNLRPLLLLLAVAAVSVGIFLLFLLPDAAASEEFPHYTPEELPQMRLHIEEADWQKIGRKRAQALATGILQAGDSDRVKCHMTFDGVDYEGRMRLKGDWVDHLRGRKWSYRISIRQGQSWNRLLTFSLMTPEARDFLHEWMFHRILQREGILSPRYGYLQLNINGKSYGMYAWEEHFEKQLVESAKRREGPILKYDEDPLWEIRQREVRSACAFKDEEVISTASAITAFKENRLRENPSLRRALAAGRHLMQQYRAGTQPPSRIFDVDMLGRFLAIADLTRTYHGLIWHNQRFYYNPITGRLEPIGFDGDTGGAARYLLKVPFIGMGEDEDRRFPRNNALVRQLFEDPAVRAAYRKHVERFCEAKWLEDLLADLGKELEKYEALIGREFPGYRYDAAFLQDNIILLRKALAEGGVE
ncbi:MAG: CotH kinase family protein [Bacteroidota bacterium]